MTITALMYSFAYLEPVCCSTSSSNCCFLTSIQVSQDVGLVVWYAHLFQNFPQFIVIHTVMYYIGLFFFLLLLIALVIYLNGKNQVFYLEGNATSY